MNIKSTLVLALAAAIVAPAAMAADLQINGEIVEGSCVPDFNGDASAITLPAIEKDTLENTARANGMETTVKLTCSGLGAKKNVALRFNGTAVGDGNLAADPSSTAEGVAFAIYDQDDKQVKVNTDPKTFVEVGPGAPAILKHTVYYVKTDDEIKVGTTSATAKLDIIYN